MQLTDDVLLGSAVDASAIELLEEIKGDRILSYGSDTRSASQLGASSSFISTFDGLSGQVGTIDPSAKFTQIASTFSFSDIAVAKDGTIFGITPTQLFKIDPVSGLTSFVGGLPAGVNINALEFANDNILYGAGDSNLYAINTTNAGLYLIGNLESTGFNSSGDLAFDAPNNRFLATSKGATSDSLYAVSLTGEAAKIGDIGFSNILGLMFEGEKLFGFTADGSRIAINPGTGAGVFDTLVKGISDRIGGASGIQIKKGEILSSTPGTILSADTIDVFLPPGGEITLEITVTVPGDGSEPIRSVRSVENGDRSASVVTNQLPLDVFLLQDLSGSFDDDLPVLKRLVPNFLDELRKIQPDTKFGVGSFIDKPVRPFGDPNNAYVYQLEQPLTNDKEVVRSTVNNLTTSTGGDLSEGQLEALLQVARRTIQTNPIGFRDNARRVVVVSTDDTYHKAGDGVDAKPRPITKPNNGDSVVDPDEDYPSIAQAKQALSDANIFPIFTIAKNNVGSNNRPFYQDLVDNKLGFGKVVELESDSSNLVQAITDGLVQGNSQVPLNKSSDDFGYVKDISPKKFENAKPGDKLTFKVKLQNDGTGRDDNLSLRIPGLFGATETKINVRTERVTALVNSSPAVIQGLVTAQFKLSPDDILFQQNLQRTAFRLLVGGLLGSEFVQLFNAKDPKIALIPALSIASKISEGATSFPYGVLGRKEFELTDTVNPSQTKKSEINTDINTLQKREIELKLFSPKDKQPSPFESETETGKTWVVIHGWNDGPNGNLDKLAEVLANARPNDLVYFLNWQQASVNGRISNDDKNDLESSLRVGNYFAAKWIRPVAEFVVTKLLSELKIDSVAASKSLNLIGHSLGSLVSGEIGRLYKEGFKDDKGNEIKPNGVGVSTITALDPPSASSIDLLGGVDYDLDGRNTQADSPNQFSEVSNYSLALVGARSLAGNQKLAATADESFQIDFGGTSLPPDEHGQVVQTFTNLLNQSKKDQPLGLIQQEIIKDRILTDRERFKARQNAYSYLAINPLSSVLAHEGIMSVQAPDQPIFLAFKDTNLANDDIVYGSIDDNIGDRKLDGSNFGGLLGVTGNSIFTGSGNDKIFGDAGKDEINGDSGDDTLIGGAGNDTLIGGDGLLFDSGKDFLDGGKGNDSIRGGGDNDTLTGGIGSDTLDGGGGDDLLYGGTDKDQDILIGGEGTSFFVLAPGTGLPITDKVNLGKVDIIENFYSGFPLGLGERSTIVLINGLKKDQIQLENIGGFFDIDKKTAIYANSEYLAVIKGGWFTKDDLRLTEQRINF